MKAGEARGAVEGGLQGLPFWGLWASCFSNSSLMMVMVGCLERCERRYGAGGNETTGTHELQVSFVQVARVVVQLCQCSGFCVVREK